MRQALLLNPGGETRQLLAWHPHALPRAGGGSSKYQE